MDYYKNISKNLGEALKSIPLIEKISDYGIYMRCKPNFRFTFRIYGSLRRFFEYVVCLYIHVFFDTFIHRIPKQLPAVRSIGICPYKADFHAIWIHLVQIGGNAFVLRTELYRF
jgi:hypothetical protein